MDLDIRTCLAWLGAIISFAGTARYIQGVLQEGTHPRLASWFAWSAANGVLAFVAVQDGAYQIAVFNALAMIGNVGVLIASARRRAGERPRGFTDWSCLSAALICLVVLLAFPSVAWLGAALALCASAIATWPTIVHAWQSPHAETWQLFAANMGAGALALCSVSALNFASIAGPLIMTIANLSLTAITLLRRPSVQAEAGRVIEELEEVAGLRRTELEDAA